MNELIVRGGNFSYKSTKQSTSIILIATVFFISFSNPFPLGSLLSFILHPLPSSLPYTWIVDGLC